MTKLLSIEDKINKILEYCEYTKQLAAEAGNNVSYRVEIENTYETETEGQHALRIYRRTFPHNDVCKASLYAQQYSQTHNCLSSVKVYIKTYNSECDLIDEDPIDEYEINFENGIEVQ